MADHVIEQHLPELAGCDDCYLGMFRHAVHSTARLIAQWQAVDCPRCDEYRQHVDHWRHAGLRPVRLSRRLQPGLHLQSFRSRWALCLQTPAHYRFMELQCPGQCPHQPAQRGSVDRGTGGVRAAVFESLLQLHRQKLGLVTAEKDDQSLIDDLLAAMAANHVDHTIFFRKLCSFQEKGANEPLRDLFLDRDAFDRWAERYRQRLVRNLNSTQGWSAIKACW